MSILFQIVRRSCTNACPSVTLRASSGAIPPGHANISRVNMDKITRYSLIKVFLIGIFIQVFIVLFYKVQFAVTHNQIPTLLSAFLDPIVFVPCIMFIIALIVFNTYAKLIKLKYVFLHVGVFIFLGWYMAFNIFELFSQRTIFFYRPSIQQLIAPLLGAYVASRLGKNAIKV